MIRPSAPTGSLASDQWKRSLGKRRKIPPKSAGCSRHSRNILVPNRKTSLIFVPRALSGPPSSPINAPNHRGAAPTMAPSGEVAEWLNAPHSKCGIGASLSGVRIPPSPPYRPPTFRLSDLLNVSNVNERYGRIGRRHRRRKVHLSLYFQFRSCKGIADGLLIESVKFLTKCQQCCNALNNLPEPSSLVVRQ